MSLNIKIISLFLLALVCVSYATDAIAAYRSNTGTNTLSSPKIRYWNSSGTGTWGAEVELPTAGSPIRQLVIKTSPVSSKTIIVTESDDGYLDAYVCTSNCGSAGSWAVTNNIGQVWSTAANERRFDVAFETTSGDALVIYGVLSTDTAKDIAYKVLPAASTSFTGITELYLDDTGSVQNIQYTWIAADSNPTSGSDKILMAGFDSDGADINALVWDGSAWGNWQELTASAGSTGGWEALAVRYSADGTKGMVVGGSGNLGDIFYQYWTGSAWNGAGATLGDVTSGNDDVQWIQMSADPATDDIMVISISSDGGMSSSYWNGATWANTVDVDAATDPSTGASRASAFAWSPSGSTGRLVWDTDTTGTTLSNLTFSGGAWGATTTFSTYAGTGAWVYLTTNPTSTDSVKILGMRLNSNFNIGSFSSNSAYTNYGDSAITANTTVATFEAYSLAFYKPDTIAPTVGTVTVVPSYVSGSTYITGTSNITATVSDSGSGINITACEYTINGGTSWNAATYSGGSCIANSINTASATSINMRVKDLAGNQGTGTAVPVTVDTTAPTMGAITITPSYTSGQTYVSGTSNISATVSDSGSGLNTSTCEYTINGGWNAATYSGGSCIANSINTASATSINMRVKDNLGNLKTGTAVPVTPDTTAPSTTASGNGYTFDTWTNASSVTVTLTCSNGGSGCNVTRYCTNTTNSCTPATTYTGNVVISAEGTTYIRYYSADNVQNTESVKNQTIKIDNTAPSTSASAINSSGGAYTFNTWANSTYVNVTLTCSDGTGSGCGTTLYCKDTANTCTPLSTYSTPVQISTEGTSYIRYKSNDSAGNSEAVKNQTIKIDNTAPSTSASAINSSGGAYTFNTWANSTYVNVTLTCSDGTGSGCGTTLYCTDTINTCTPSSIYSAPVQISTPGTSYIRYRSNDTLNNVETVKNQTIMQTGIFSACVGATQNFTCGQNVTESCTMTKNISITGATCFTLSADNITLNCNGFTITGNRTSGTDGIDTDGFGNHKIKNCIITNFETGILLAYSSNNSISNITAYNNSGASIYLYFSNYTSLSNITGFNNAFFGIYLWSSNSNSLFNITTYNNSQTGIFLGSSSNNNSLSNITAYNNTYDGIFLQSSNMNSLSNIIAYNNTNSAGISIYFSNNTSILNISTYTNSYGIFLRSSNYTSISNIIAYSNTYHGIYLGYSSNNNALSNITAYNNSNYGIYLWPSNYTSLSNIIVYNNTYGIGLDSSNNNSISNISTYSNSQRGIYLGSSNYNSISNITAYNNDVGIYLYNSSNNYIYNNFFNNTNNFGFGGTVYLNNWNTTQTTGTNIIGGPYIGGNYWANPSGTGYSQACPDANVDGFCDLQYNLTANNTDYLPLTAISADITPPTLSFISPTLTNNSWTANNWVYVNVSASETISAANLEWNGANQSMTVSGTNAYVNKTALSEGTYTYKVWANDTSNNWGVSATQTVKVDTTAPQVGYTADNEANNAYLNRTYAYLEINYTEANPANCTLNLNGTNYSMAKNSTHCSLNKTGLSDTYYEYNITLNDSAGNNATTAKRNFTVDTTAPQVGYTADNEANNAYLNRTYAYFEINYTEANPANCTLNLNGTIYQMTKNSTHCYLNKMSLTDGYYEYNITLNDSAGNNATTAKRNFTIDTAAPQISYTANNEQNNAYLNRTYAYFEINYTEANPANCTLNLNGTNYSMAKNSTHCSLNKTGLSDTYYEYNITLNDSAGNNATTAKRNFTVDTTAPQVGYTADNEANNAYLNRTYAYFEINYTEANPANCTLNLNGTIYQMSRNTTHCYLNKIGLSNGYYDYNITLNDSVGWSATTAKRNFTVDTLAPSVTINSPANDSYVSVQNVSINYTVNDTNLNFTNISIYDSAGALLNSTANNYSAGMYNVTLFVPAGGGYNVTVVATDLAGNSNSATNTNISVATAAINTSASAVKSDGSPYDFGTPSNSPYLNVTLNCSTTAGACDKTLYCTESTNTCEPSALYTGTFQISTQGTSYIRYMSNDTYGNNETVRNKTIVLFTGTLLYSCTNITAANSMNYLEANVSAANATCFIFSANNITLDCNGHSITGESAVGSNAMGVLLNKFPNNKIKNCNISGFVGGINAYYSNSNTIANVSASGNIIGILLQASSSNAISNVTVYGNAQGIYLQYSSSNALSDITAYGNGYGIYIFANSTNNSMANINSYNNQYD